MYTCQMYRYGNNCICSDHCDTPACYQGDVDAAIDYGFDSMCVCGGKPMNEDTCLPCRVDACLVIFFSAVQAPLRTPL